MVIDSGSVLESVDPADDLRSSGSPPTKARCDNDTRCATAHVFVESWALSQLAHAKPPPPSPPQPPSLPPPQDPPLAPFPPLLPPSAKSGYRLWSPAGWEPPLYDSQLRMYTLKCGLLTGDFMGTIYASKSQIAANTLARRLIEEGTYTRTRSARLSARAPSPSTGSAAGHAVAAFGAGARRRGTSTTRGSRTTQSTDSGGTPVGADRLGARGRPVLTPVKRYAGVTVTRCAQRFEANKNYVPHALWLRVRLTTSNAAESTLDARRGDCVLFRAARSEFERSLWRGFYEWAQHILRWATSTTLFRTRTSRARASTSRAPSRASRSTATRARGGRVALDATRELSYAGPRRMRPTCSPRPTCSRPLAAATFSTRRRRRRRPTRPRRHRLPHHLPTASCAPSWRCPTRLRRAVTHLNNELTHSGAAEDVLLPQTCWRWEPENDWPPFMAHRDVYEQNPRCAERSAGDVGATGTDRVRSGSSQDYTRAIQWGRGLKQPSLPADGRSTRSGTTTTTAKSWRCCTLEGPWSKDDIGVSSNPTLCRRRRRCQWRLSRTTTH